MRVMFYCWPRLLISHVCSTIHQLDQKLRTAADEREYKDMGFEIFKVL